MSSNPPPLLPLESNRKALSDSLRGTTRISANFPLEPTRLNADPEASFPPIETVSLEPPIDVEQGKTEASSQTKKSGLLPNHRFRALGLAILCAAGLGFAATSWLLSRTGGSTTELAFTPSPQEPTQIVPSGALTEIETNPAKDAGKPTTLTTPKPSSPQTMGLESILSKTPKPATSKGKITKATLQPKLSKVSDPFDSAAPVLLDTLSPNVTTSQPTSANSVSTYPTQLTPPQTFENLPISSTLPPTQSGPSVSVNPNQTSPTPTFVATPNVTLPTVQLQVPSRRIQPSQIQPSRIQPSRIQPSRAQNVPVVTPLQPGPTISVAQSRNLPTPATPAPTAVPSGVNPTNSLEISSTPTQNTNGVAPTVLTPAALTNSANTLEAYAFDQALSVVAIVEGSERVAVLSLGRPDNLTEVQSGDTLPNTDITVSKVSSSAVDLKRGTERFSLPYLTENMTAPTP